MHACAVALLSAALRRAGAVAILFKERGADVLALSLDPSASSSSGRLEISDVNRLRTEATDDGDGTPVVYA